MLRNMYLFLKTSQNIYMSKKISFFILVFILCIGFFSCVFPYPVFQKQTNISSTDIYNRNNYKETEINIAEPESNTAEVHNLNWFDSVNSLFPSYTKTRVIDIQSGQTYFVYRIGGSYHADVEPIDQENTAIFHSLYDNEYSWVRRPVWVEIKPNFFVAGSINGYPHGQSFITNNNMDGHTCIHFLSSKTHGTKKVDSSHQNCVTEAYKQREKLNKYI